MRQVDNQFEALQLLSSSNRAPRQPEYVYRQRRQRVLIGAAALFLTAAAVAPSVGSWLANRVQGNPVDIPDGAEQYVVQPGDTAIGIARSYGLDGNITPLVREIEDAARENGQDGLQPNEKLVLPAGVGSVTPEAPAQ